MNQAASRKTGPNDVLTSTNPARGFEVLGSVPVSTPGELAAKVAAARAAQKGWRETGLEERVRLMRSLRERFAQHGEELARRTALEMGMPINLSRGIVSGGLAHMDWQCENAARCLAGEVLYEDEREVNTLVYEPRGVIACVVAWNFPFGNFVCSAVQALLAGNAVVMKYSEEVPLFSKYLEELIAGSDLPKGVVGFVYGDGDVGKLLADQDVDFLSFTGSSATGRKIYQQAAARLLPVALELGGSSPGIVFADCTVDAALIESVFWKRFENSAQFCDGLKRLIVHENLMDEVLDKLGAYATTKIIGDPLDPNTELGPLVAERQVVKLEEQLADALAKGAELHCGGKRPAGLSGAFFEPTILSRVTRDMRVWREEVFGPALPVVSFRTYEEAIELANDTPYGLSGSVYTGDPGLAGKALRDIRAGSVDHNSARYWRPQNPFGGYKASGIGRQMGEAGFREACQIKVLAREKL